MAELLHFLGDDFPAEHPYADRGYAVPGPAQDRLNGVTPPTGRLPVGLYRTVLHEGLHDDLPHCLNQDLLLQMWPVLRTLVGRTVHTVWEDASLSSPPAPGQPGDGHAGAAHAAPGGCDRARLPVSRVLTGGYAVRAHRLVNRPSQDLGGATENPAPMADITATLRVGLEARAWKVHALETAPPSARFTVSDPATGQECEVDILKEIFWRPVAQSPCPSSRRRT